MTRQTVTEALAAQMLDEQDALLARLENASEKLDLASKNAESISNTIKNNSDDFRQAVTQFIELAKKDIEESANVVAKKTIIATAHEQQEALKKAAAEAFNSATHDELKKLAVSFQRFKAEQRQEKTRLLLVHAGLSCAAGFVAALLVVMLTQ